MWYREREDCGLGGEEWDLAALSTMAVEDAKEMDVGIATHPRVHQHLVLVRLGLSCLGFRV